MLVQKRIEQFVLPDLQERRFCQPHLGIKKDFKRIYKENRIVLGFSKNEPKIYHHLARKNTKAVIGVALGDEGKGRFVDNAIEEMLKKSGIKKAAVVRFQGGNNAGHTLEKNGKRLDLHLVPSGVFHKKAIGIMDRGMVIHPEDLKTEVEYVEKAAGSLKDRLFLSDEAILCTDLERAEETLNNVKCGKTAGGTGRGISPSYAHHYDRLGLKINDLMDNNWKQVLQSQYKRYEKEFYVYDIKLSRVRVPDFKLSHQTGKKQDRTVGSFKIFLERLERARTWLIQRKIVSNTYLIHQNIFSDKSICVIFEGSQAAGLDAWLGTRPDVTSSNTSCFGVREGTGFWLPQFIEERIGVFKATYCSSVGARSMPTKIPLPKDTTKLDKNLSIDQKWAAYVREKAREYGTTTGRPRDINFLDIPMLVYNARMSGVEMLAATHLDIARENETIKVCTHYKDKNGNNISYQPSLRYLQNVVPRYIELPGWDGKACQKAKKMKDLPENALKFLAFIQARTGFPMVAATTGTKRENIVFFDAVN